MERNNLWNGYSVWSSQQRKVRVRPAGRVMSDTDFGDGLFFHIHYSKAFIWISDESLLKMKFKKEKYTILWSPSHHSLCTLWQLKRVYPSTWSISSQKLNSFFHAFYTMESKEVLADYHYKSCEFILRNKSTNERRTVIASRQRPTDSAHTMKNERKHNSLFPIRIHTHSSISEVADRETTMPSGRMHTDNSRQSI